MSSEPQGLATRIFNTAWMAIVVVILIELALVVVAVVFGKVAPVRSYIADLAGKISWSIPVCVGIAAGTAASSRAAPLSGFIGLLAAPSAFALAKVVHKTVAQALDIAVSASPGPNPGQMMTLRAVEYAILGFGAGMLASGQRPKLQHHAVLGLSVGAVAAGIVLLLTARAAPAAPPPMAMVSKAVNEVLFPLGCSIVLYTVNVLGKRVRITATV